ncbi:MAG: aldo/keto reductase [Phycisphaerae bacterium]|jgi:aryl-alcohol dehydrogenase-like predicted oxidoreductase|nr:aldo/keto reductase [Phycisphaerae bacterium]MDP7287560.1 aldo/keto reductase [Phycisphaerae bacterium]
MKTIAFGNTGVEVSAICLGAMEFGTGISKDKSYEVLDAYFENGGRFLDTANIYAHWLPGGKGGDSEAFIGQWMRDRGNRSEMFIATKLGFDMPGEKGTLSAEEIRSQCEASLDRMGIETVDLYYAHRDDQETPLEETLKAFDDLVTEGKVRFLGASNFMAWRLERARTMSRANGWAEYCCLQQRHSYLRLQAGTTFAPQLPINEDLMAYSRAENFPMLAYTPLLGGCYVRDDRKLPAQYLGVDSDNRIQAVRKLAAEINATPNQIVLAWMMQSAPPIIPLIATGNIEHLRENLAVENIQLTSEQIAELDAAGICDERNMVLIS